MRSIGGVNTVTENPAIRIDTNINAKESMELFKAPVPSSPTDSSRSPCSARLWGKSIHRNMTRQRSASNPKEKYSLAYNLLPHQLPMDWRDKIILGSSSVSRKNVLKQLGWEFRQMSPDIDEKSIRSDDPLELPLLIATAKAEAIVQQLQIANHDKEALIITADQVVLFQNEIREKPENEAMAIEYLSSYSDHHVSTISAVVCTYYPSLRQEKDVDVTTVYWGHISDETVAKVVAKGEIFASAGGFRIEDDDLVTHIRSIEGTVDSVFGLPVNLMIRLMNDVVRPAVTEALQTDDE